MQTTLLQLADHPNRRTTGLNLSTAELPGPVQVGSTLPELVLTNKYYGDVAGSRPGRLLLLSLLLPPRVPLLQLPGQS